MGAEQAVGRDPLDDLSQRKGILTAWSLELVPPAWGLFKK